VLTSRSEGIPLALMEAMAHAKVVLAPEHHWNTGIGVTAQPDFLYRAERLNDFVSRVEMIHEFRICSGSQSSAAQQHVSLYFDRDKNLAAFGDLFSHA